MLSMLNFLSFKTEFVMLYLLNFLGLKTEIVMFYMQLFFLLVFRTENSIWCSIACMKNMQNFLGIHAECFGCLDQRKLSFVCPFMHDQHAEFSGLPCRMFWVFRSKKTQFCVSFHA